MATMLIRHLTGSKAGATEQFVLNRIVVLSIGRSTSCHVRFSGRSDPLVSRVHAKIECAGVAGRRFRISDLGSTNGTFVNDAPIRSTIDLYPGDVIRLGSRGPEFMFDIYPRPAGPAGDLSPVNTTVIAGAKTFIRGFIEYEERKSAVGLFVRVFRSPVRETMRVVLQGDRANPFKFMAIAYALFVVSGLGTPLFPFLRTWFPALEEHGKWLIEIIETAGALFVLMLFAYVQYRFLRRVSPERRRFRQFLVLSAVLSGMLFALMGLAQTLRFFIGESAQVVVSVASLYWGIQSLRISKRFWGIPYVKLLWYQFVSVFAATLVYLAFLFVLGFVIGVIAAALGHPLKM
jgi:FHA domain-containing protein